MYTEETVRKELRGVARKRVNMSALIGTRDYLTAQIKYLGESDKLSPETETALASATKTIISLIEETAERDSKYIKCISSLTQLHKTIILEHYFNGTAMWKVAESVGYSERQAKEHLRLAIKELTAILNSN